MKFSTNAPKASREPAGHDVSEQIEMKDIEDPASSSQSGNLRHFSVFARADNEAKVVELNQEVTSIQMDTSSL